jgi:hypothetical protein
MEIDFVLPKPQIFIISTRPPDPSLSQRPDQPLAEKCLNSIDEIPVAGP